ncbi:MAG: glycosyltransferase family 2 protein [Desulfobacula sp.]|uniref:glycosyltransferase family 2 protein n=1 Tax=Desulfobacula sp. TaxID=2593537 RepID=UPI0025BEE5B6|nr:glycosyltransferase family 2 protein [Desulfobacula sp.]MCD4721465.1 glycosyltransferase family 2 protein [Desulfobacula sp.]
MKIPLSVFIIAKNEEKRIFKTIDAVKNFADEIIVVEDGSTDNTVETAEKAGAKVVHNKWKGYGPQKKFGENLCKNKWVLSIDADEEVTSELADEIIELFTKKNSDKHCEFSGYKIKITNTLWYEKRPNRFAGYINRIRLYDKSKAGFKNSTVHDCVIIKDVAENSREEQKRTKQLKNIIIHRPIISIEQKISKINFYSTLQAENAILKRKKSSTLKITFGFTAIFFKYYILKRYFIYGIDGIALSMIDAFAQFLKYYKIKELNR